MFQKSIHRSARKQLSKLVEHFENETPDHRTGLIFALWLTRGYNLAKLHKDYDATVKMFGSDAETLTTHLNFPIYYYLSGFEVPISQLITQWSSPRLQGIPFRNQICSAFSIHYYTAFAASYPFEGYEKILKQLWDAVLCNYTNLKEVVTDFGPLLALPDFKEQIENNDVSIAELMKNPNAIMPHYFVLGHPLSVKLMERQKMKIHFM